MYNTNLNIIKFIKLEIIITTNSVKHILFRDLIVIYSDKIIETPQF